MAGKFKKKSNNSFANKISTLANVVEVPPPILASFDKASDKNSTPPSYLAAVLQAIDQHRLKIWDVKTSVLIREYSPKQVDCRYTSLTWGESVEVTEIESDVSLRKKRKGASTTTVNNYIALGTENGDIEIYSLTHGDVIKRLQGGHNSKVVDFVFSENSKKGYSIGTDGYVVEWDINNGMEMNKWLSGIDFVTKLNISKDNKILYVAGQSINLFDLETKSLIKTYPGHATDIRQVVFSENNTFITVADQDRFISIWGQENNESGKGKTVSALTMDTMPVSVSVNSSNNVLAIGEDGILYLWNNMSSSNENNDKKKRQKILTKGFDSKLKIVYLNEEEEDEEPQLLNIMFASFVNASKTGECQILVGYGSMVRPKFEIITDLVTESGEFKEEISLSRSLVTNLLQSEIKKEDKKATGTYTQSKPGIMMTMSLQDEEDEEEAEKAGEDEKSLEERIKEMEIKSNKQDETSTKSKKMVIPKGESIQNMLQQAVHSNDKQLLETCLSVTNIKVIRNTLERLPPQYVIPFLNLLKERIQKKPQRGCYIFDWIRYTIMIHMSYLISVPELTSQLGELYQLLQERSSLMGKLSQLNGRLDLINSQFVTRNQMKISQEAEVVYDEEAEDNTDMEEDEEEGEDDEFDSEDEFYEDGNELDELAANGDIEYFDEEDL
ncbi:WD40 repeat-like protein [Neocallimastix lanati (nom. inval.)]|uniref:WD40 repeat-like protein n=1 Tax=Neocallimastix californiae TaxID=1754190 RepID=A0A1Y2FJ11_9FUNG|nr:WD40 repeat-like protein [Neocallimastix sp. JGI-2020a]ORY83923.1 WD40 repeat-like protein [Neocallimastix californiae]|eukprot:ORY83923.1 WD40 repeat-like protein [Neocallimastix californiae]